MMYPNEPTELPKSVEGGYQPDWYERDYFLSVDGNKEFPGHHCKITWLKSFPHIESFNNAIDIGCRDGEYSRYLANNFNHVYCFDYRPRALFNYNIPLDKITLFHTALGETETTVMASGGANMMAERAGGELTAWTEQKVYALDQFNIPNVDYIKIDVDGFEVRVLTGARETILKHKPVLVVEDDTKIPHSGVEYCQQQLNYQIVDRDKGNVVMKYEE